MFHDIIYVLEFAQRHYQPREAVRSLVEADSCRDLGPDCNLLRARGARGTFTTKETATTILRVVADVTRHRGGLREELSNEFWSLHSVIQPPAGRLILSMNSSGRVRTHTQLVFRLRRRMWKQPRLVCELGFVTHKPRKRLPFPQITRSARPRNRKKELPQLGKQGKEAAEEAKVHRYKGLNRRQGLLSRKVHFADKVKKPVWVHGNLL
jgi:hypothetical protein